MLVGSHVSCASPPPTSSISYTEYAKQFEDLQQASDVFAQNHPFPTSQNRIKNFATTDLLRFQVVDFAQGTRPIIHHKVAALIQSFLSFKKEHGTSLEQKLYAEMTSEQFIDRCLKKRPLVFVSHKDQHLRRDGKFGLGGFDNLEKNSGSGKILLSDYISYDEMPISALIGMSTPTHFINSGDRGNQGIKGAPSTYEESGIYVGLVGARFERLEKMDWKHTFITPFQNTASNGYGLDADKEGGNYKSLEMWAQLYGQGDDNRAYFPSFKEAIRGYKEGGYILIPKVGFLNVAAYKARIKITLETLFLEANARATAADKEAFVSLTGLGLGVWAICEEQKQLFIDVVEEVISENNLSSISDVDCTWFPKNIKFAGKTSPLHEAKDKDSHPIAIHFSKRSPAEKLSDQDEGKLLVATYAWDGNSYPGNEYWAGGLTDSGDPAAACCSFIAELQNPEINPKVSGQFAKILGS